MNETKQINIGLIGCGTVGGGVATYFESGRAKEDNIHLKKIVVTKRKKTRDISLSLFTTNVNEVIMNPEIDIVVELIGGIHPAKQYILAAISQKKSVVTANKAVMALHAHEFFSAARAKTVDIGFEASVGGGIQLLSTLERLKGDKIKKVMGILNGTTNFILTQMENGLDFQSALKQAQNAGFAEANHILDTGGFDTRDKLALIASLVFNARISPKDIYCEGITTITPVDIDFARKYGVEEGGRGYAIKLLAIAERQGSTIELRVNPVLISRDHPLASVRGEFNAVFIDAELTGEQMFYGKGAGTNPTTSAVISDIRHIAHNIRRGVVDDLPSLTLKVKHLSPKKMKLKGYIRTDLRHTPGSLAAIATILASHKLNIEDSFQRKKYQKSIKGQSVMPDIITITSTEKGMIDRALTAISRSKRVYGSPIFLSFAE